MSKKKTPKTAVSTLTKTIQESLRYKYLVAVEDVTGNPMQPNEIFEFRSKYKATLFTLICEKAGLRWMKSGF